MCENLLDSIIFVVHFKQVHKLVSTEKKQNVENISELHSFTTVIDSKFECIHKTCVRDFQFRAKLIERIKYVARFEVVLFGFESLKTHIDKTRWFFMVCNEYKSKKYDVEKKER